MIVYFCDKRIKFKFIRWEQILHICCNPRFSLISFCISLWLPGQTTQTSELLSQNISSSLFCDFSLVTTTLALPSDSWSLQHSHVIYLFLSTISVAHFLSLLFSYFRYYLLIQSLICWRKCLIFFYLPSLASSWTHLISSCLLPFCFWNPQFLLINSRFSLG